MTRNFLRGQKCAMLLLGSVCGAATITSADMTTISDARIARLDAFFRAHHCPAPLLTSEYLAAADANFIDYRLLPAVSVRESTCGLHARHNNRWGWNSAKTSFETLVHGIRYIARELASGRYYRGKTLEEKLQVYNPNPNYPAEVRKLMREIETD